jgi:predicted RNA-binding protein with RPS1 domain
MNESDATNQTTAPAAVPTAPTAEASAVHAHAPADGAAPDHAASANAQTAASAEAEPAAPAETEPVAPAEAEPAASDPVEEAGLAAVEINPAAEPPADEEAPAPVASAAPEAAEDPGATPVEINPAAEPVLVEDVPAATAALEPAGEADGVAEVEINPAAEPPAAEPAAEDAAAAETPVVAEAPAAAEIAGVGDGSVAAESAATEAAPPEAVAAAEAAAPTEDAAATDVAPSGEPAPASPAPAAQPAPKQPDPRAEERRQRAQQAWERVVNARESGEVLTGTVTAAVKGGLLVDVGGIRGFLPASQVRVPLGTAIDTLVKTKVPLKVIDVDQTRRRIVVSHRRAAEEERRNKRSDLLRSLAVGQVREGVVVRLADFGAFVDLGGVDGLIPMRELAFERIDKAGDVVTIGEHLQVEVLRIDENGKKISLSRKNALPDPWRDHAGVLRQGSSVQGKVVGKEPRLQVELAPGVVGSVGDRDADPADYEIGEAIEVLVRRVDRATRRITLTTMHGAAAVPPPQSSSTSSGFAPLGVELGRRQ